MSKRLNQEREAKLQPDRIMIAVHKIKQAELDIWDVSKTCITINYNGNLIRFYPYSGWHTGKGIKDGRGLEKLLRQLRA